VVDTLAASQPRQYLRFFVLAVGRDEQRGDGLADGFLGRVTEKPLSTSVPARDDAVEVLAYDGVVRRIHDGAQQQCGIAVAGCGINSFPDVV
jgi:hypothetical protein